MQMAVQWLQLKLQVHCKNSCETGSLMCHAGGDYDRLPGLMPGQGMFGTGPGRLPGQGMFGTGVPGRMPGGIGGPSNLFTGGVGSGRAAREAGQFRLH